METTPAERLVTTATRSSRLSATALPVVRATWCEVLALAPPQPASNDNEPKQSRSQPKLRMGGRHHTEVGRPSNGVSAFEHLLIGECPSVRTIGQWVFGAAVGEGGLRS